MRGRENKRRCNPQFYHLIPLISTLKPTPSAVTNLTDSLFNSSGSVYEKHHNKCVAPRFSFGVAAVAQFTLDFSDRIISPLLHRTILFGVGGASEPYRPVATKTQKASFSSVCRSAKGTAVIVTHLLEP